ncbi:AaceriABR048Wp [[Ashbya] aceris (nom. inval.)]|nr:AaceriABR048Wp [[Ashbya] aceris (nom. inval.)]
MNHTNTEPGEEHELIAIEALSRLCNGTNGETRLEKSHGAEEGQAQQHQDDGETLLCRMRQNPIFNNAVNLYEQTKSHHPNFRRRAELVERSASTMVRRTSEFWAPRDGASKHRLEESCEAGTPLDDEVGPSPRVSKRQKIKENLKEYRLAMSIESKKQLITCLHLLKLANRQLSSTVGSLQDLVQKEREDSGSRDPEEDDGEQYFDASETIVSERSKEIKMEVVGTVKKVYSLISRFAGSSLPEPARSQVRETLLKMPTNWSLTVNSASQETPTNARLSANSKMLILAEESLDMVSNIIQVFDMTLGRAEEWVKHKQELKELIKSQYIEAQLKSKVKQQLEKEQTEQQRHELKRSSV